jgi:hypothetical protein
MCYTFTKKYSPKNIHQKIFTKICSPKKLKTTEQGLTKSPEAVKPRPFTTKKKMYIHKTLTGGDWRYLKLEIGGYWRLLEVTGGDWR